MARRRPSFRYVLLAKGKSSGHECLPSNIFRIPSFLDGPTELEFWDCFCLPIMTWKSSFRNQNLIHRDPTCFSFFPNFSYAFFGTIRSAVIQKLNVILSLPTIGLSIVVGLQAANGKQIFRSVDSDETVVPVSTRDSSHHSQGRRLELSYRCTLYRREIQQDRSLIAPPSDSAKSNTFDHSDHDEQRHLLGRGRGRGEMSLKDRMKDSYQRLQDQMNLNGTSSTSGTAPTGSSSSSDGIFTSDWFCGLSDEDSKRAGGIYYVAIDGLDRNFLAENHVRSGMNTISVTGAYIDPDTHIMHIPPGSSISIGKPSLGRIQSNADNDDEDDDDDSQEHQRQLGRHENTKLVTHRGGEGNMSRKLTQTFDEFGMTADIFGRSLGARKLLVLRVQAFDSATSASESQLSSGIFGNSINLKTMYEQCSGGNIQINPATGPNIVNGVATISLSRNAIGRTIQELDPEVQLAATAVLGDLKAGPWDFVMICMPKGVTGG